MTIQVTIKHETPNYDKSILISRGNAWEKLGEDGAVVDKGINVTEEEILKPGQSTTLHIWKGSSIRLDEVPNE